MQLFAGLMSAGADILTPVCYAKTKKFHAGGRCLEQLFLIGHRLVEGSAKQAHPTLELGYIKIADAG